MIAYSYPINEFPNSNANLDNLKSEIEKSSILIAIDHIDESNSIVAIFFKSELGSKDNSTLDIIVSNHDNISKRVDIVDVNIIAENKKFVASGDLTNDMYKAESWVIDVPSTKGVHTFDFYKPYPISLLAAEMQAIDTMIGDELSVCVAPDTIIGGVTLAASIGDTLIHVTDTVTANLIPGRYLKLGDFSYEAINVNASDNTIEIFEPLTIDVNPGDLCKMNIRLISDLYVHTHILITIGKSITTGQRIPANTIIRVNYNNATGLAKKIAFIVEFLY